MATFQLEIISPLRSVFNDHVHMVTVPTPEGIIGVLAHHMPLFSEVSAGEITIHTEEKDYYLATGGGFVEVVDNKVLVLVSRALHAHEINEAEIQKAQEEAREVLATKASSSELMAAQAVLRRSTIELKVLRRRDRRGPLN